MMYHNIIMIVIGITLAVVHAVDELHTAVRHVQRENRVRARPAGKTRVYFNNK